MTRKDYIAVAEVLRIARTIYDHEPIDHIAAGLVNIFAYDNPRFDRGRFMCATHTPSPHGAIYGRGRALKAARRHDAAGMLVA